MTMIETCNAPGFGPPFHKHAETEIFHVLEGRYLFDVDGKRFVAHVGDTITVPGGIPHGFVNLDDRPSRQLVLIVPGLDAKAFFTELGDVMKMGRPDAALQKAFARGNGALTSLDHRCVALTVTARSRQADRGQGELNGVAL